MDEKEKITVDDLIEVLIGTIEKIQYYSHDTPPKTAGFYDVHIKRPSIIGSKINPEVFVDDRLYWDGEKWHTEYSVFSWRITPKLPYDLKTVDYDKLCDIVDALITTNPRARIMELMGIDG